jgi:hypothetical protein
MAFAFAGNRTAPPTSNCCGVRSNRSRLSEKANAVAQTKGVLSRNRQLQDIMEMTPDQIQQNEQELQQDAILEANWWCLRRSRSPPRTPPPNKYNYVP